MRDEPSKGRFNPPKMAHDPENEMLAAGAFRTGQVARKRVEEGVEAFATLQPAADQSGGRRPGHGASRVNGGTHLDDGDTTV